MRYRTQLMSLKNQVDLCLESLVNENKNEKIVKKFEKAKEIIEGKVSKSEYSKFLNDGKKLLSELKNNKNLVNDVAEGGEDSLRGYKRFHQIFAGMSLVLDSVKSAYISYPMMKDHAFIKRNPEFAVLVMSVGMTHIGWMYEIVQNSMNPQTPMGEFIEWCAKSLKRIVDSFGPDGGVGELIMSTLNYFIVGIYKNIVLLIKIATTNIILGLGLFGTLVSFIMILIKQYQRQIE